MVSKIMQRSFINLMVLPELNYREVQPDGVLKKIDILYRSTLNDSTEVRGWRDDLVAEIVSIDNPVIYQLPRLKARGITNAKQLRAYYREVLNARLKACEESDKEYKSELAAVIKEQLKVCDSLTEGILGGIHRGLAFPEAVAKLRKENVGYSDQIPVELYNPVDFKDLIASAHRRNGQEMNQVMLTPVDYINMAVYVMSVEGKNQSYFRTFATTGSTVQTGKESGEEGAKDVGGKFTLYWLIGECITQFPKLQILERLAIAKPTKKGDPEDPRRIEISRLQVGPLEKTDKYRNIHMFRVFASPVLRAMWGKSSRANKPTEGTELRKQFDSGIYWTDEEAAAWWNGHCPGANPNGMPEAPKDAVDTVNVEQVQRVASMAPTSLVKSIAGALIGKGGGEATIGGFQEKNDDALKVADGFFRLATDDVGVASTLTKISVGLEAVRDKDPATFRQLLSDLEAVVEERVKMLAEPAAAKTTPPKGGSKSPPSGRSKSPAKKTAAK